MKWYDYDVSDDYDYLWFLLHKEVINSHNQKITRHVICVSKREDSVLDNPVILFVMRDGEIGISPCNFSFPITYNRKDFVKACRDRKIYFIDPDNDKIKAEWDLMQ